MEVSLRRILPLSLLSASSLFFGLILLLCDEAIKIIISRTTDLEAVDVLAHFYTVFVRFTLSTSVNLKGWNKRILFNEILEANIYVSALCY